MNHKLRALVRINLDPGQVTLEISGCLTPANFPVLLHLLLRAQKLATCPRITLDFRDASHLDASVLSYLEQYALPLDHGLGEHMEAHHELEVAAAAALEDANDFQLTIVKPAELPVCPVRCGETDAESGLGGRPMAGSVSPLSLSGGPAGLLGAGSAR